MAIVEPVRDLVEKNTALSPRFKVGSFFFSSITLPVSETGGKKHGLDPNGSSDQETQLWNKQLRRVAGMFSSVPLSVIKPD